MLRIAIVEDEPASQKTLQEYVARYAQEKGEEIQSVLFEEGLTFLDEYQGGYDIIFMDIVMPHLNGMETARQLRKIDETVFLVFITSMAQYALQGYEVNACAFLVKPALYGQFQIVMDKIRKNMNRTEKSLIAICSRDQTYILPVKDITYLEVFNHSLVFHTQESQYEIHGSLSVYEEDSRFSGFVKISKSHLVNIAWITAIEENTITVAGEILPLSRRRKKECLEKIAKTVAGGLV